MTMRKTLKKEINIEKNFKFRPYSYTPREVLTLQFYEEESGLVKLTPKDKISMLPAYSGGSRFATYEARDKGKQVWRAIILNK